MAETRQIGRLTFHFLGDDAARLGKSFDDSFSGNAAACDATKRSRAVRCSNEG
jgi:hypothetical protein